MTGNNISNKKEKILIDYISDGVRYQLSEKDFEKVKSFCENECWGIKFLISATFLRKMVRSLLFADFQPPFTYEDFKSDKFKKFLEDNGIIELMKNQFGTDDVELLTKIIIKSTYDFIHTD